MNRFFSAPALVRGPASGKTFYRTHRAGVFLLGAVACLSMVSSCQKKEQQEAALRADSLASLPATNERIVGVARVEPEDGLMTLTAGSSGRVLDVLIDENDTLVKGQALLTLDKGQERSQLSQATSKAGTQQAAIAAQQAALESLRLSQEKAQQDYQRNLELYAGKAVTKKELDDSKAALDKLKRDVEQAEAQLREAQSRLREVRADIGYYRTVLNDKSVNALVPGRVLKVLVKQGDYVSNDTPLADFAPAGPLYAKTEVDELYAERVKVGQRAVVVSQTTGDTLARGEVTYAADYLKQKSLFKDQATELEDRRVREVSVRLESGQMPLIGSRVDCIIFLK